ncbi:phosphatase PAP2 family protein [Halovenus rubra]|uniref:Phosphatase PAP2 family protein n=2 Tax=Halovenus rubra TaxID=869890 RepID=A0ABD5XA21_9EURY|nr:phosphatase PAP2 family protein [Halovenus rubra]
MSRGLGVIEPIQSTIPDWLGVLVAVITQLGDGWFLLALLGGLYVTQRESQTGIVLVGGVLACGVGAYSTLKQLFARPRPTASLLDPTTLPEMIAPLYEFTAHASGYGFPSGHATMATVAYLGLATVLDSGSRRQRFLGAGIIVVLVAFSRVALGVHFLVDVIAGMGLGLTLLAFAFHGIPRLSLPSETTVLTTAVLLSAVWVGISHGHSESLFLLCGSVLALGAWVVDKPQSN